MFARSLSVVLSTVALSVAANAGTTAAPAAPAPPIYGTDPCASLGTLKDKFTDNAANYTPVTILNTGAACTGGALDQPASLPGDGAEIARTIPASTARNARDAAKDYAKSCASQIQGLKGKCVDFMGHTAGEFKKEADDYTQQMNEAKDKAIQSEQNFQNQQQQLTDHMNSQKLLITSTLPAEHNKAVLGANQNYQNQLVDANDAFTKIQGSYTQAQKDYADAVGQVKSKCYSDAVTAYQQQKTAINNLKAGNGVNVNSARLVTLQNSLRTYQARKYQECMGGVAGAEAMNAATTQLANQKQQLSQQVAALNVTRSNYRTQLNTNLGSIETDYKAKLNDASAQLMQDNNKMMTATQTHALEAQQNQDVIANLQKLASQAQQTEACIETKTGPVAKSEDDSANPQVAYTAMVQLASACHDTSNPVNCPVQCSGVPNLPTLAKATAPVRPASTTTTAAVAATSATTQTARAPATPTATSAKGGAKTGQ